MRGTVGVPWSMHASPGFATILMAGFWMLVVQRGPLTLVTRVSGGAVSIQHCRPMSTPYREAVCPIFNRVASANGC